MKIEDYENIARSIIYEEIFLVNYPHDARYVYQGDYDRELFLPLGIIREMLDFYVLTALSIKFSRLKIKNVIVCLEFVNLNGYNGEFEPVIDLGSFQYDPSMSTADVVDKIKSLIAIHEYQISHSPYSSIKTPGLKVVFKK